jgi:phage terminase large subunit-like protein
LRLTPGNVTDYDFIRHEINLDRERFRVREIAYDPWNATQLVTDLMEDGAALITTRQGYASMSPATKELNRLLLEGLTGPAKYRHGEDPLLRWTISNFAVDMDAAGNVKPSRASARDKIDPIVAGIMALDRAMRHEDRRPAFLGSA